MILSSDEWWLLNRFDGRWYSKTLARAKFHVRSTRHKVEYRQTRFGLIQLPDPRKEEQS